MLSVTILVILIMFSSPISESINPHTFGDFPKIPETHKHLDEEATAIINDSAGGNSKEVGTRSWRKGAVAYVDEERQIVMIYVNDSDPPERRICTLERDATLKIVGFSPERNEALVHYAGPKQGQDQPKPWLICVDGTYFFYPL